MTSPMKNETIRHRLFTQLNISMSIIIFNVIDLSNNIVSLADLNKPSCLRATYDNGPTPPQKPIFARRTQE